MRAISINVRFKCQFLLTDNESSRISRLVTLVRVFKNYPSFFYFRLQCEEAAAAIRPGRKLFRVSFERAQNRSWRKACEYKGLCKSPRVLSHLRYSSRNLSQGSTDLSRRCIGRINVVCARISDKLFWINLNGLGHCYHCNTLELILMNVHTRKKNRKGRELCFGNLSIWI